MTLADAFSDVHAVLIDSAPAIYHLEDHPIYSPVMAAFFQLSSERSVRVATSPVTLGECLIHPLRLKRDDLVERYTELILSGENTEFYDINSELTMVAAQIRAEHGLRLLDAFQIAVARKAGCEAILTNDSDFRRVDDPRAILLDDFVGDETT
jgi:predicted nucleic acid-binding protein